jgi:Nitric oxide synthase, oxygenase domain
MHSAPPRAGTVYADPYPGFVHGVNPAICKHGCAPVPSASLGETAEQKLWREAAEFVDQYCTEMGVDDEARAVHACLTACSTWGIGMVALLGFMICNSAKLHRSNHSATQECLPKSCLPPCHNSAKCCQGDDAVVDRAPRGGVQAKEARKKEVCDALARDGTYEHTFEELQWGARVAWRNHGQSPHRAHWNELMLLDHRGADTPAKMFEARA